MFDPQEDLAMWKDAERRGLLSNHKNGGDKMTAIAQDNRNQDLPEGVHEESTIDQEPTIQTLQTSNRILRLALDRMAGELGVTKKALSVSQAQVEVFQELLIKQERSK